VKKKTQENAFESQSVFVKNGTLCFPSWDCYSKFQESFYSSNYSNLDSIEKASNFYSLKSLTAELVENLNEIKNQEQLDNFFGEYSHIFSYEDSVIDQKSRNLFLNSISNSEGYFCVNNQLFRIYDGYKVVYKKASSLDEALNSSEILEKEALNKDVLKSVQLACGSYKSAFCGGDYNTTNGPDRADRRVFLRCYAEAVCPNNCSTQTCYQLRVVVFGQTHNWFGWQPYKTYLSWKDIRCKMYAPDVTDVVNNVSTYEMVLIDQTMDDFSTTTEMLDIERSIQFGETVQNTTLPEPNFMLIKAKASSRGVGDYCAEIDCGEEY